VWHDDDDFSTSTLLALSSSPGLHLFASLATPFHSIVDSIVGRTNQEASAPFTLDSDNRVITNQYSLGLRNKRVLPAVGNAPSLVFGSQVNVHVFINNLMMIPLND
jgi:hypothetical protein